MPLDIVVGTQWGDEGKGHITDLLAGRHDIVARFSGGDNAGHTVTVDEAVFRLHLIPSGVTHRDVLCVLGNGVVINPKVLLAEMRDLKGQGIDLTPDNMVISEKAHLITPSHIALDKAYEAARGMESIGTTLRGIGPAYTDKSRRSGIRAGLLRDPESLADAIQAETRRKNEELVRLYGAEPLDAASIASQFAEYAQLLGRYVGDTSQMLEKALKEGKMILAEGAQGTLLDLDHGTYPFVTSSWPTAAGASIGLGIGPKEIGRIIGVAKAFTSRVGSGPFPSELTGSMAARLRGTGEMPWDEYGTTTGRPRRVGWLDTVILRYAKRINSLTEIALTKLDILSGIQELPVCVAYEIDGRRIDSFPSDLDTLSRCQPMYETLPGWEEDISGADRLQDFPPNAIRYVNFIADELGIPITYLSVGPARDQIIEI